MTTKISVTKQELLAIANEEFTKEANYRPHLRITDIRWLGHQILLEILTDTDEDKLLVLQAQEFANRLGNKYTLID